MSEARAGDRRVQRTQAALRLAFNQLILSRGYDAISAADIAAHADVGRSTFYEHFGSKDAILAQSLGAVLGPLADACVRSDVDPGVTPVIEHFWANRKLARALMGGRARAIMTTMLAQLIEERLAAAPRSPTHGPSLPLPLAAAQLAHGALGLIEAWLTGRHGSTARQIAEALGADRGIGPAPASPI